MEYIYINIYIYIHACICVYNVTCTCVCMLQELGEQHIHNTLHSRFHAGNRVYMLTSFHFSFCCRTVRTTHADVVLALILFLQKKKTSSSSPCKVQAKVDWQLRVFVLLVDHQRQARYWKVGASFGRARWKILRRQVHLAVPRPRRRPACPRVLAHTGFQHWSRR